MPVTRVKLQGHSHLSERCAVNTDDRSLSDPVLKFIQDLGAQEVTNWGRYARMTRSARRYAINAC